MNIRHLQLNTLLLKDPEKVVAFIKDNKIDIACLQEVTNPIGGASPLKKLCHQAKLHYIEGIHFYYHQNHQVLAAAIISRFPITGSFCWYHNTPDFEPKQIQPQDQLFKNLIENNFPDFPASRGLINSIKSRCVLQAVINTPEGLLHVLTTHYNVSDLCTETPQMYELSQLINSVVSHSASHPTIFSADLNIRAQSYSVTKLSENLICHTSKLTDTLSQNHRAKKLSFPDGLAIDHVFSKKLKHLDTNTLEIDFSKHKALISNFSL